MTLPEVRDRQEGFSGGLNTTSDDTALRNNECRTAKNVRLSTRGAAEKRGGTQQVSTAPIVEATKILGGFSWKRTTSVQELVISGGKLWTGTLGIPMTWTDRGGTFSATVNPTFAAFKGPTTEGVYIADGGALNFWDGTTLTENIAGTPSVEAITSWGPRLFAVKGDTLYWSGTTAGVNGHTLGNASLGGGLAIVRTYGGQELIMPFPLKSSLLLFHRQAISRFTGATQQDINIDAGSQGISGDVGTVAKRSIIGVENAAYFLTDRGVFAATETDVTPISSPLENTLSALNKTDWAQVDVVHARAFNEIRWSLPNLGTYVYNYRTQGWSGPWDNAYCADGASMWDSTDSEGRPVVLIGHCSGHVLWADREGVWLDRMDSDGDNGTTYEYQVKCRRFFGGDFTAFKSWRNAYLLGDFPDPEHASITVESGGTTFTTPMPWCSDLSASIPEWGAASSTWGDASTVWGGGMLCGVERVRSALHGVHPWVDVTVQYTGDAAARLSIVDVIGHNRNRR
jgi:hypothetical protein